MQKPALALVFGVVLTATPQFLSAQIASAIDQYVSDVQSYNLMSLGSVTFNQVSDVNGGIAVNGAVSVDNNSTAFTANMMDLTAGSSFYAIGQLSIAPSSDTATLQNGYAALSAPGANWQWSGPSGTTVGGTTYNPNTLFYNGTPAQGQFHCNSSATQNPLSPTFSLNWSTLAPQFQSISNTISSPPGGTSIWHNRIGQGVFSNLKFTTAATGGVVVFNMAIGTGAAASNTFNAAGNKFNGANVQTFTVNVPTGFTYVINVTGLATGANFLSGVNPSSGTNNGQLLWNFNSSANGNFNFAHSGDDFYGSVLAPNLVLTSSMNLDGELVVGGLTENNDELHDFDQLAAVPIPEPSTVALWLGFAGGCAALFRISRFRNTVSR